MYTVVRFENLNNTLCPIRFVLLYDWFCLKQSTKGLYIYMIYIFKKTNYIIYNTHVR